MNSQICKLYSRFDSLYRDIHLVCSGCDDHDCEGFVWLLKEESFLLYDMGVPIMEINDSTFFIHSFEESNGELLISKPKPPCRLRKEGFCSIYSSRPLVCRMYPVGFASVDDDILLVLHKDCKFSRSINGKAKALFIAKVIQILKEVSLDLLVEISDSFREVEKISAFPEGPNAFETLTPLRLIGKERRW